MLSTVDLLELTSSDELISFQEIPTLQKQATLMRKSTVLSLPVSHCALVWFQKGNIAVEAIEQHILDTNEGKQQSYAATDG
jgi:hypothetical protein